ncbi:MAG: 16S rRNA (uracil(1498)-N(3))-methyltransferase [Pseudomonadales bacterium]|jgi:RsmE family RNA methyltransferase|uniref:16S rRNA (uracil(1498)-N(3))-methyltransferase n=1 Tax=Halopseudomonas aestusnigri TaxID=857252 RepID=UPI000C44E6C7|nr:16S rRNA (uracil(1498)-N(3))-methyltransferase [Pseudomonadales bacterium]MBP77383.1 16S rRNA (uracil(1498)-N(3))-methyltransferase [Pseudomonadales bacterium]MEE2799613.1 16S rRNA (uracil(1498)-N(3))-methyltransferase [Pseudomonadota bacterium]|tara:strand:- start:16237 stop:16944 length:708 start_codon:yes stop_codon:yes gene_type:complete
MNLLLLEETDFIDADHVRLSGRRLAHMLDIQQVGVGDTLRVGRINGLMGQGTVLDLDKNSALLNVVLNEQPPAKLPLTLLLAMPRPKMFRRILQHCATLGVPEIILLNSVRVEKSFWQTPFLQPEVVRDNLLLGLEQARDTVLPAVRIEKRFKPFVEDSLPGIIDGRLALVAHPGNFPACPRGIDQPLTLAIGPEGGWVPYEVDKLIEAGMQPVQLGDRILRVETAVTALVSRLF